MGRGFIHWETIKKRDGILSQNLSFHQWSFAHLGKEHGKKIRVYFCTFADDLVLRVVYPLRNINSSFLVGTVEIPKGLPEYCSTHSIGYFSIYIK